MPVQVHEYQFAAELTPFLKAAFKRSDFHHRYFLVPGTRDRRWLRDVLVGEGTFGGDEPPILRWEELYREASARLGAGGPALRRQIDPPDHWLIVRHILEEALAESPAQNGLPAAIDKPGFISVLGTTLRELLREEVLPEHISVSLGCSGCNGKSACPVEGSSDRLLCSLYHKYTAYLEAGDLFDSAQAATVIREMVEKSPGDSSSWLGSSSFIFTGFLSFTHGQLLLLRCLHDAGADITILTPATGLDIYGATRQLETILEDTPFPKKCSPLHVLEMESGDHRLEIEHLVRNLALWEKGIGPLAEAAGPFAGWEETALAVDDSRLSLLEELLKRYHVPYFIDDGPGVAFTPLWKTASRIWDIHRRGYPPEETAWLLAEPFLCGSDFPLGAAKASAPSGRGEWERFLDSCCLEGRPLFNGIASFAEAVAAGGTPADLLESLREMASGGNEAGAGWDHRLSRLVADDPGLDEEVRRMSGAMRELEGKTLQLRETELDIGPAGRRKLSGDKAMAFLSAWAKRSTIWQAPKKTGSLTVYTGTPPVLAHHPVFALAGVLASSWPGRLRQSPLLPDEKREQLHNNPSLELGAFHLPLLAEIRRQRQALFRRVLACGDTMTIISRPRQDASGRPLQPSPFIRDAKGGDAPWVTPLAGEPLRTTMKDVLPGGDCPRIRPVEVRETEAPLVPARLARDIPRLGEGEPPFQPTPYLGDIDLWESCPFRYYARRILGLREPRPDLFDPARAGSMIHELWNRAWRAKTATGRPLAEIASRMWEETVNAKYPELSGKASPLRRHWKRLRDQVLRLAEGQDETEDNGLEALRKEQRLEGELSLTCSGVTFTGRFDRLEILDSGFILIDYKSGSSASYGKSLQLPAYVLAMEGSVHSPLLGWGYLCLGDGGTAGRFTGTTAKLFGKRATPSETLETFLREAERALAAMADGLASGRFPPKWGAEACRTCGYRGLCRLDEKPGGGGVEDE